MHLWVLNIYELILTLEYYIHLYYPTLSYSIILAQLDNYIIFGFFTLLGVAGVVLMLFIVPISKKKVSA